MGTGTILAGGLIRGVGGILSVAGLLAALEGGLEVPVLLCLGTGLSLVWVTR